MGTKSAAGLLTSVDSMFTTQEEWDNAQRSYVTDLFTAEISDSPNHPFKVRMDESMTELADSVKERGVLSPVLVRPIPDGGYQMVSGHRRKMAADLAGLPMVPCIVQELEATISLLPCYSRVEGVNVQLGRNLCHRSQGHGYRNRGRPQNNQFRRLGHLYRRGHDENRLRSRARNGLLGFGLHRHRLGLPMSGGCSGRGLVGQSRLKGIHIARCRIGSGRRYII